MTFYRHLVSIIFKYDDISMYSHETMKDSLKRMDEFIEAKIWPSSQIDILIISYFL